MKTRAAVLRDVGKPFEIVELDLDEPKANEVLIRFVASGLCHSDDHLRTGDIPVRYPIEIGKPFEIVELDLDEPKANEVLIRFVASGLCHSDDHLRTGDIPVRYPIVGGHEG